LTKRVVEKTPRVFHNRHFLSIKRWINTRMFDKIWTNTTINTQMRKDLLYSRIDSP
jgi:hypothetical protein